MIKEYVKQTRNLSLTRIFSDTFLCLVPILSTLSNFKDSCARYSVSVPVN